MLTIFVALVSAFGAFVAYDSYTFRDSLARELTSQFGYSAVPVGHLKQPLLPSAELAEFLVTPPTARNNRDWLRRFPRANAALVCGAVSGVVVVDVEREGLIDFMDLSIATFYNLYLVEGSMHTPLGYTIPLAAGMRERLKIPVFCTGRINDPVMAEKVLAAGQADMIGMCRGLICDPFLPKKAFEGRMDDIRYCIGDNQGCIGRMGVNKLLGCIQNPAVGLEKEWGEGTLEKAAVKKKVFVVGGGPGGMWAAKMAGRRGHNVTLFDRNETLGGQVLTAMKGSGRDEFGVIIRNEKEQVTKAGATVKLTGLGAEGPVLDLVYFQRSEEGRQFA